MSSGKRWLRAGLQWLLILLVGWGIYATVRKSASELGAQQSQLLVQAAELREQAQDTLDPAASQMLEDEAAAIQSKAQDFWKPRPAGLLLASGLYAIGMFPAALFWKRCLSALGQSTYLLETLWAYFLGNLGKYFPGKAMVLILRVNALKHRQVKKTATTISIFIETLTMMSVGGAIAAVSLIALNIDWRLTLLAIGLLSVTFIPTCPPLLRIGVPKLQKGIEPTEMAKWTQRLSWRLSLVGWASQTVTWTFFSASLIAVLWSLPSAEFSLVPLPTMLLSGFAACSLAVVLGFVSLIPGGAGVRELVLSAVLAPIVGPTAALCVAVWMRIVWLLTELATVAMLGLAKYLAARISTQAGQQDLQPNVP